MKLTALALVTGLGLFLVPSLAWSRPMTQDESRCFELSEAVYQAVTPQEWDSPEPYPVAEVMSEQAMVDCLAQCGEDNPGLYDWSNYTCQ